ncbi:MAG TPA: CapA family protein [Anaerolineae bacterium]|nr:CapA family protein [Anaerolineae bacterium]
MRSQLPGDAREVAVRSPGRKVLYNTVFKLADVLGFWRRPQNLDPDDYKSIWDYTYWQYKSRTPIVRPEAGLDLAPFHAAREQIGVSLLPARFEGSASVEMSAVGDLTSTAGVENSQGRFYEHVADLIFDTDLSIANLESTLTKGEIGDFVLPDGEEPMINATLEQYHAFKAHQGRQYTILQTANNHILDRGMEGFDTTHDQLEADGFLYLGTNRTPEAQKQGLIVTFSGLRLGLVGATYGINSRPFPDGKEYLVNLVPFHRFRGPVDLSLLEDQIGYCKSQRCDFVTLCLHWGLEFEFFPRQEQVDITHALVESGADLIISHHAHNIQPLELYHTKRDPDRIAPILYGLGNLSSLIRAPHSVLSLIANMTVAKGWLDGLEKTLVERVTLTPVVQMEYDLEGTPYVRVEKLNDALREAEHDEGTEAYLNQATGCADLVLGTSWRRWVQHYPGQRRQRPPSPVPA